MLPVVLCRHLVHGVAFAPKPQELPTAPCTPSHPLALYPSPSPSQDGVALEARPAELGAAALVCRPAASLRSEPLRVAVVGFGTFGQFLARRWVSRGHHVLATSRTDYSALASSMGVDYFTSVEELSKQVSPNPHPHPDLNPNPTPNPSPNPKQEVDVVLVSTSIMSFEAVLKTLPTTLTKGKLVVDVLSVKSHAKVRGSSTIRGCSTSRATPRRPRS